MNFIQKQKKKSEKFKIKVCSAILCCAVAMAPAAVSAQSFKDVPISHWAYEYIKSMSEAGYIKGYGDGYFKPDNPVSRWESLIMASRILGFNLKANDAVKNLALNQYSALIDKYSAPNKAELSYLMYWGVLGESDLSFYLDKKNRDVPLKRHEIAVLITKVMGGEKKALENVLVTVNYKDSADIPASAKQYVEYLAVNDVMKGDNNNKFLPGSNLSRAEMSTLMLNAMNKMDVKRIEVKVEAVNTIANTVTLSDSQGSRYTYPANGTVVRLNGKPASIVQLSGVKDAVSYFQGSELRMIEAVESIEEIYEGTITGISSAGGSDLNIAMTTASGGKNFSVAKDFTVSFEGSEITADKITKGQTIKVTMNGGAVTKIEVRNTVSSIKGIVSKISVDSGVTLTVTTDDNRSISYDADSGISVTKNKLSAQIQDIIIGDTVTLTIKYNKITKIEAYSSSGEITGTISEIYFSNSDSYITVLADGVSKNIRINSSTGFTLDGMECDMYKLQLGSGVNVKTENDTAVNVHITTLSYAPQIIGTIKFVNSAYNIIGIETEAGQNMTVVLTSGYKLIDQTETNITSISKLKANRTVVCVGAVKNGVYEANTVMITK